jgi:hypothetical protein
MAITRLTQSTLQQAFPKYPNAWDGVTAVPAMDALGTIIHANNSTGGISWANIPQTYQYLQIRFTALSRTSTNDFSLFFNSVSTGTSYTYSAIVAKPTTSTSSASSTALSDKPYIYMLDGEFTNVPSGQTLTGVINIHDYANTNKFKTISALYGSDQNGNGLVINRTALYKSTNAITTLDIFNGYYWATGTTFSLYGIK